MHQQATTDLASTKASLAKSEEARVRAEVRVLAAQRPTYFQLPDRPSPRRSQTPPAGLVNSYPTCLQAVCVT